MQYIKELEEIYKDYKTLYIFSEGYEEFQIINPFKDENISVNYEYSKNFKVLDFYFSYQHVHIISELDTDNDITNYSVNLNEVTKCIDDFITIHIAAIEFFRGDRNAFGGGIYLDKVNYMSVDELSKNFGYEKENLYNLNFKIRTWDGKYDADIKIVSENDNYICKKIYAK